MNWRWLALGGCLITLMAAGLWLERPFQQRTAAQPSPTSPTSCRLPVYLSQSKIGGFLSVPGYSFSPDPKAQDGSRSYDAALGKWLPVEPRLVSRDGNWWVYQTPEPQSSTATSAIHLVDRHGADRTVWSGKGIVWVMGWTDLGAVFVHTSADLHHVAEYWLVQTQSGSLRSLPPVVGEANGTDASGGWGLRDVVMGPANDNNPPLHWTLTRTDMITAKTVTWWEQTIPGLVQLLGFDVNQHPILRILPDATYHDRLVVLTAPRTETEIVGDAAAIDFFPTSTLADEHGIWFGDSRANVWLWRPAEGLRRVAQLASYSSHDPDVTVIGGPCRPHS